MEKIWAALVDECDELGAFQWEWRSADGAIGKARFGGDNIGPNPTDRCKNDTKRSLIVDEVGGPLGALIAGANVHDTKLLEATIEAIVVKRPEVTEEKPQNLCLDKDYDNPTGRPAAAAKGHTPHIRQIGEEKPVKREKKTQATALCSGEDSFLAFEVSCHPDPIRQELIQLPGFDPIYVELAVVSKSQSVG
jgi:hypothetical protein